MSCYGSKTQVDEIAARLDTCPEVEVQVRKSCCMRTEYYVLNQAFAVVRHGHRLDHTPEWNANPDRNQYPNDTPLSAVGFEQAHKAGDSLLKANTPWKLIVSSPYCRCAQTACCIAQRLMIPIHFDLDLGEVFDKVSMIGDCTGQPQHRPPDVLEEKLKLNFPHVEYIRDENGSIKIEGKLQNFPESFDGARMRYGYKIKKLLQRAAADLSSFIIVTHGDAVSSVLGLLRENWIIENIPLASYVIGKRQVKVFQKGDDAILKEEPVYEVPEQWALKLHPLIQYVDSSGNDSAEASENHAVKDMMEMEAETVQTKTAPPLDQERQENEKERRESMRTTLVEMGASPNEFKQLLSKKSTKSLGASTRVACHPDHIRRASESSTISQARTKASLDSET